jgi:hypothetical protein
MDERHTRAASETELTGLAERCEPSAVIFEGGERVATIDLATIELSALVEQALSIADARGLGLVGIDLCSALERLKRIEGRPDPKDP